MRTREVILLRLGRELAQIAIADLPEHRLVADVVERVTGPLPLDLAVAAAPLIAKGCGLPTACGSTG